MSRRHHSKYFESRPRSKRLKRRIRNMILEIGLLAILIFVAIKFIKKDSDIPKVINIDKEMQVMIIDKEMNPQEENNQDSKELIIEQPNDNINIIRAIITYKQESDETIINCDIKCNIEELQEQIISAEIIDKDGKIIKKMDITITYLKKGQQTRINIVLNGDYTNAKKIKINNTK